MLSIITPNLNNGKYLEDNILSIQKLKIPFEHIIVDGGSTDNSLEIIQRYPHIKLLHQTEKTGMYGAIHQGFVSSKGDYITWINADDQIIPKGTEGMYKESISNDLDFTYSDGKYYYINENKFVFSKGRIFGKFFLNFGCIPTMQPSIIFSKKIYNTVNGFDYKNYKICGDLDLFVKIAKHENSRFKYIPIKSSIFIKRGNSLGDLNTKKYLEELVNNNLPKPNFFIKIMFYLSKYI